MNLRSALVLVEFDFHIRHCSLAPRISSRVVVSAVLFCVGSGFSLGLLYK